MLKKMEMEEKSDAGRLVLGTRLDLLTRGKILEMVSERVSTKKTLSLSQIVTAYSEFYVQATKDVFFKKIINEAWLVIPDGIGPLGVVDFKRRVQKEDGVVILFLKGLWTGIRILARRVGEPVSGVSLFLDLVKIAGQKKWKVFLLGGFDGAVYQVEAKLKKMFPALEVVADQGEIGSDEMDLNSPRIFKKINDFYPDLLFVAYGPVKQEKWIFTNRDKIRAKIAIGVGGTFNEILGTERPTPVFIQRSGLKWLWRLVFNPRRIRRIVNAYLVFSWKVFREVVG